MSIAIEPRDELERLRTRLLKVTDAQLVDAPDSPHVVRFFNNYGIAQATVQWATQKWSRG